MFWLLLCAVVFAMDCKSMGFDSLDRTFFFSSISSTPPTNTNVTIYFNPCGPVKGAPECSPDDNLCLIERVLVNTDSNKKKKNDQWVITAVKSFGSAEAGAKESVTYGNNNNGEPGDKDGSFISLDYVGADWGGQSLQGRVELACSDTTEMQSNHYGVEYLFLSVDSPALCAKGKEPDNGNNDRGDDNQDEPSKKSGWGFFSYLGLLILIFGVVYLGLVAYVNASNRGYQPDIGATIRGIVTDLPYLLGDLARKIRQFFTGSRSGYSAV